MNSQRTVRVIVNAMLLSVFSTIIAPGLSGGTTRFVPKQDLLLTDGGAPVPPYPKPPIMSDEGFVIADGGAPVPPYPKPPTVSDQGIVMADGGAPVPPYPKPPVASNALIADGGAPVPPYPKPPVAALT
jgi:hypothetical protein